MYSSFIDYCNTIVGKEGITYWIGAILAVALQPSIETWLVTDELSLTKHHEYSLTRCCHCHNITHKVAQCLYKSHSITCICCRMSLL